MLKSINKSTEQTINTLIDITAYSWFDVSLKAINSAKRQHLSLSRIEILLSTLKSAYLTRAAKEKLGHTKCFNYQGGDAKSRKTRAPSQYLT